MLAHAFINSIGNLRLTRGLAAIKLAVASVFSNYSVSIVNDFKGMDQMDGFTCPPITEKVLLQFHSLTKEQQLVLDGKRMR